MAKQRNFLLFIAGMVILAVSSVCGFGAPVSSATPAATVDLNRPSGGGANPEATHTASTVIPVFEVPSATAAVTAGPSQPPVPTIPESRRLTLEYPPRIRAGDSDVIRLTLEVDTLGNVTPTAEIEGNKVQGQVVEIPNVYDSHVVIAEARLDLAGVEVRPPEAISEPLLPGQKATFYWSVHPQSPGTYRGTAWLFLNFIDKASKEESRKPIAAQTVTITATSLFGMNGTAARAAGGLGSVVGAVLGFPFIDEVLKWLWRRTTSKG